MTDILQVARNGELDNGTCVFSDQLANLCSLFRLSKVTPNFNRYAFLRSLNEREEPRTTRLRDSQHVRFYLCGYVRCIGQFPGVVRKGVLSQSP